MKRTVVLASLTSAMLLIAACNPKECRCYKLERWGNVRITSTYIDNHKSCADLGYDYPNPDDSSFRFCTDIDAPLLDTMDIVRMFWKQGKNKL